MQNEIYVMVIISSYYQREPSVLGVDKTGHQNVSRNHRERREGAMETQSGKFYVFRTNSYKRQSSMERFRKRVGRERESYGEMQKEAYG